MSRCIVSVGVGAWYKKGVERLERSLGDVGYDGALILHKGVWPEGYPAHYDVPYAFKLGAIQQAVDAGHERVLWLDASAWAVKDPVTVFRKMEEQGHYFWRSGHKAGTWCNEKCLAYFGVTRERAMEMEMLYALVIGLDFRSARSRMFFKRWREALDAGVFVGSWDDHRHDQSAATLIAHELGMEQDMGFEVLLGGRHRGDDRACLRRHVITTEI